MFTKHVRLERPGLKRLIEYRSAGTGAPALEDIVTFSDELSFASALPARVAGCSTMITEPAQGTDREAPPSREECGGGLRGQPLWYDCGRKSYRCQSASSYQVTCTACPLATASLIASVPARLGGEGTAGRPRCPPTACFHIFDGGIQVGLQLAQMTAQVPHHPIRGDRIPVGPLDLDDDKHLLIAVHLNGQVDAAPATSDEPPLTFPES